MSRRPFARLDPLVELVYEATLDPSKWTEAVSLTANTFGGAAVLFAQDTRSPDGALFEAAGFDPAFLTTYFNHYAAANPWTPGLAVLPSGAVATGDDVVSRTAFERNAFYNEWLRPQGLYHGTAGILAHEDGVLTEISVLQPFSEDAHSPEEFAAWTRLVPHFRRAMRVRREIGAAGLARDAGFGVLERLAIGVLIVDAAGRILFANRAAQGWLRLRDGIAEIGHRLHAETAQATEALMTLVRQAAKTPTLVGDGWLPLPRRFGPAGPRRHLGALVCPLLPDTSALSAAVVRPAALVLIQDPDAAAAGVQPSALMRLLGLTRAEAQLAAALAEGKSIEEIALSTGTSINTVRTHLKNAMTKTGTNRQGELVALVLRSVILSGIR